jgi:hypothetical protein
MHPNPPTTAMMSSVLRLRPREGVAMHAGGEYRERRTFDIAQERVAVEHPGAAQGENRLGGKRGRGEPAPHTLRQAQRIRAADEGDRDGQLARLRGAGRHAFVEIAADRDRADARTRGARQYDRRDREREGARRHADEPRERRPVGHGLHAARVASELRERIRRERARLPRRPPV